MPTASAQSEPRPGLRWPLRNQILLPFCGAMIAVVALTSVLDAYLAAERSERRIEEQLLSVAETLQGASYPLTSSVLHETHRLSGIEFIVADAAGNAEDSSFEEGYRAALPNAASADTRFRLAYPLEMAGQRYLHGTIRLQGRNDAGDGDGVLHVLYPESEMREARWQAAYPPLAVGAGMLGVVVILASLLAARISRPIVALRDQLSGLVAGNFQRLEVPPRNDEMSDLVRSANELGGQLDDMRRAIKRSERLALLGQLSGGLGHQLRNAITGARLAVQLHQRQCPADTADSLTVALRQLTLSESHLQQLLRIGRPTAPLSARCDLAQVVADAAALIAPACRHRRVALSVASQEPLWLVADADQLRQLLVNLAMNALEAAGPGGWVRIGWEKQGREVVLRVYDSGPGPTIDPAEQLFEPLVTTKPEGIGLGLAVARRIAEAHGGTLSYVPGEATCFELRLPAEQSPPSVTDDSGARESAPAPALLAVSESGGT